MSKKLLPTPITRRRLIRLGAEAASAAGVLALVKSLVKPAVSVAAPQSSTKDTMFVAYAGSPVPLDPVTALGDSWALLYSLLYNPLYSWDKDGKLYPDLAAAFPQFSTDLRVYTIKLRQGVRFHNGREAKAGDVKFSIERATKPSSKGWASGFISDLIGVDEVVAGSANEISGLKVLDDYTLQFTLKAPRASFVQSLGLAPHAIVPREDVERWGDQFGSHPVGTGPYKVTEWEPDVRFDVARHAQYYKRGKPSIPRISFKLRTGPDVAFLQLQRGEVDLLWDGIPEGQIPQVVGNPRLVSSYAKTSGFSALMFAINTTWPGLEDTRARQALSLAIDRKRILQLAFNRGSLPNDMWQPRLPGYKANRPPLEYAPDKAKQLLDQSGIHSGFRMKIAYRGAGSMQGSLFGRIVASLQQDLQQVGVASDIVQVDPSSWIRSIKDPKFTASFIHEWSPNYPDPFDMYSFVFSCSGAKSGTNRSFYCDGKLEGLVSQAEQQRGALDPRRIALYQQVADVLLAELPEIPLYYTIHDTLHSGRVRDLVMHPLWFYSFEDCKLAG